MDVLDLLLRIEKQLSKAKDNRDRSSLEKIYYALVVIDDSISALDNNSNNNNIRRVITFDELARQLNDQTKQNIKEDVKKSRVRVPRIRRDVVKDGNHPLLAELDDRLKEIRQQQQQQQQFDQQIKKDKDEDGGSDNKSNNDDNSVESTIDRMLDDVSTALDDYDNYKISFEIGAEQYNNLKKWQKSIDDRLFRYQLETGKCGQGAMMSYMNAY